MSLRPSRPVRDRSGFTTGAPRGCRNQSDRAVDHQSRPQPVDAAAREPVPVPHPRRRRPNRHIVRQRAHRSLKVPETQSVAALRRWAVSGNRQEFCVIGAIGRVPFRCSDGIERSSDTPSRECSHCRTGRRVLQEFRGMPISGRFAAQDDAVDDAGLDGDQTAFTPDSVRHGFVGGRGPTAVMPTVRVLGTRRPRGPIRGVASSVGAAAVGPAGGCK